MLNSDLIAYCQPIGHRFNSMEWQDAMGGITDIQVTPDRLTLRAMLSPGLYACEMETRVNAFDMRKAKVKMIRVPDGKRVWVGPWDFDHLHQVMALPMAKVYVNRKLKAGLWFSMPGPEQIAENRLSAEFGFEAGGSETELVLEFTERDKKRIGWDRLRYFTIRRDDRRIAPLQSVSRRHPRIYLRNIDVKHIRRRLVSDPRFRHIPELLRTRPFVYSDGGFDLDLACVAAFLTGDRVILNKVKTEIMKMANMTTWSGMPDPLLMGGDNDRAIGYKLYLTAMAWEFCRSVFNSREQRKILAKAEEYLQKMYDFTVLQRAYMGQPATDAHSLGAWFGVGVAGMAFYDDLAVARKSLPFFNGLFTDSLKLFPSGGKTAWITFHPMHLVRYLAAAITFGGDQPDLNKNLFLDNLGRALFDYFEVPNVQELQRGLRTHEHRLLTAFLCRFHPTAPIASIYEAFVEREQQQAKDVWIGLFDLLYAPDQPAKPAKFPNQSLFDVDIGNLIASHHGEHSIKLSMQAGLTCGRVASFYVAPHNREFNLFSLAGIEVASDGKPLLINVGHEHYGIDINLKNNLCLGDDGGLITNGQYLNGQIGPEKTTSMRRGLVGTRFVYVHAIVTNALRPGLMVRQADRIVIFDQQTGVIVVSDAFEGERCLRFATHLHCAGSIRKITSWQYRFTGGQANLIAGVKGGSKGLSDEEYGELFVTVLNESPWMRVRVYEPTWVPGYIYGINGSLNQTLADARYPHLRRWRLEMKKAVSKGAFLYAVNPANAPIFKKGDCVCLPDDGLIWIKPHNTVRIKQYRFTAEAVLFDQRANSLMAMGCQSLMAGNAVCNFTIPVDIALIIKDGHIVRGQVYSSSAHPICAQRGLHIGPFQRLSLPRQTIAAWHAEISSDRGSFAVRETCV